MSPTPAPHEIVSRTLRDYLWSSGRRSPAGQDAYVICTWCPCCCAPHPKGTAAASSRALLSPITRRVADCAGPRLLGVDARTKREEPGTRDHWPGHPGKHWSSPLYCNLTVTVLTSVYCCSPYSPSSRPMPDCLKPPKGAAASNTSKQFTHTVPARILLATA
jgi:hypothetical protein